jgi:4-hydroxybenzoate polyprenyltransferase
MGVFFIGTGIIPLFFEISRILSISIIVIGILMVYLGIESFLRKQKEESIKFLLEIYIGGIVFGLVIMLGIAFFYC